MMVLHMVSWKVVLQPSSLSDSSLRLEVADLEELEPKKLRIPIFYHGELKH